MNQTRKVEFIPEVKGCYGPRLWIPEDCEDLRNFVKLICLWGGPVNTRVMGDYRCSCYELPLGTTDCLTFKLALERLNIELIQ